MTQLYYHRQESTWSAEAHKEGIKITSWLTLARSKVYFFTKLSNSGIKVLIPNNTCSTNRDMEKTRFQQTLWEGECDFKKYNYEMRADTVQWVQMKAQSGQSNNLTVFHAHHYTSHATFYVCPVVISLWTTAWLLVKDKTCNSTSHREFMAYDSVL